MRESACTVLIVNVLLILMEPPNAGYNEGKGGLAALPCCLGELAARYDCRMRGKFDALFGGSRSDGILNVVLV